MAFWGRTFIFDNIPSELYSLVINSNDGESSSTDSSGKLDIKTEKIFRRYKPYFYGTEQNTVLELSVSFTTTEYEITQEDSALIQKWLFGKQNYKKIQIVQEDMEDYYFNCILNDPRLIRVGNIIRGFECTMVCDSQFAYGNEKKFSSQYNTVQSNTPILLYNESDNNFYNYPSNLTFTMNGGGNFTLINHSDANRTFEFTSLGGGETITVDNDRQIIISNNNTISNRLANFNKNFFRLVPGYNNLSLTANITHLTIGYIPEKRIS